MEKQNKVGLLQELRLLFQSLFGMGISEWIMKNFTYFFFIIVLMLVYIANGHTADKVLRDITQTESDLKQLKFEFKTLKSEIMYTSEEIEVLKVVQPLGLYEGRELPDRLQLEKRWSLKSN